MTSDSEPERPRCERIGGDPPMEDAVAALAAASDVTVLCHVAPDADTIGSGLALAIVLHRRGAAVRVSFAEPDALPSSMAELPGIEHIVASADVPAVTDLVVTVDCGSTGRLGGLADRLAGAATVLVIDHHRSNTRYGSINVVDEHAESTAGLVARVLDVWGVPIDRAVAHCLYAGLVTDTGSFRWVRPGSHMLAERLLATGVDGCAVGRTLLDTHPFGWLPMLSRVLGSARLVTDAAGGAGLVYAMVRRDDAEGLRAEEMESVIDIVRTTAEADVAATFKQSAVGPADRWTVSLRSRNHLDMSEVARRFNGGGHRSAAGYTTHGSVDEVVSALLAALEPASAARTSMS